MARRPHPNLTGVGLNSRIQCSQADGRAVTASANPYNPIFKDVTSGSGLDFRHQENEFIDFKVEVLLPYQLSKMGPALATADVNADGLDDIFWAAPLGRLAHSICNSARAVSAKPEASPWEADKESEDVRPVCRLQQRQAPICMWCRVAMNTSRVLQNLPTAFTSMMARPFSGKVACAAARYARQQNGHCRSGY